jgi:hypothetical protein
MRRVETVKPAVWKRSLNESGVRLGAAPSAGGYVDVAQSPSAFDGPGSAVVQWSAQDSKKDPMDDPDAIGNRNVGQGVNFYFLEGIITRVGQNIVRSSDAKVPFTTFG